MSNLDEITARRGHVKESQITCNESFGIFVCQSSVFLYLKIFCLYHELLLYLQWNTKPA